MIRMRDIAWPLVLCALLILGGGFVVWHHGGEPELPVPGGAPSVLQPELFQAVRPIEPIGGLVPERVALGRLLFRDTRLSADRTIACSSCHDLARGGVDGRQFSVGIGGALGAINAPSVFDSGYGFAQFWDGRAPTLEEQAAGPIHNPIEMGSNWSQVLERLRADPALVAAFERSYPDGLDAASVADAIASFERSLVTLDSRFDRYLRGDAAALDAREIEGYRHFRELGCTSCHQGILLGGNMYQKFGVLGDYFAGRAATQADLGRYNVTGREEDRHVFKVPGLRNVALTAPYFHDGSAGTLAQAVAVMARYQLGRTLSAAETEAIVAFLETLTGRLASGETP